MAATNSTMLPLGTSAPDFRLPDVVTGKTVSLADFANAPALVVMFVCNHCPFVKHIQGVMTQMARDLQARGGAVVAISSNDAQAYPQDGPAAMKVEAQEAGYSFPYLFDDTQSVAKACHAACTPDFFVFDREHRLVYRGQMDDARMGNPSPVTGGDIRAAVEAVLAGKPVSSTQKPSIGCNIKWKPGNEPEYFR